MKKIIQFFIPPSVPAEAESQRKARLLVSVLLIIVYFNLNYCVISYLIDYSGGIASQLPLMVLGIITLFLYRKGVKPELLNSIYFSYCSISIAITVYYTGGFSSLLFPWLASTPIVAVLVWSRSGGWFSSVLVILIELFFFYLYSINYVTPNQIKPEYQKVFYLTCSLGLPLILFFVANVFENARQAAMNNLTSAMRALDAEKQKSENLLLNILPLQVASELKQKGEASPRSFKMASILFTDFKSFTKTASSISPLELIQTLNQCFSAFDDIIVKHHMEKIKTIGDAYMCAGGVPEENNTNAVDAVSAALEINNWVNSWNANREMEGLPKWEIRIGVHTGELIAGVVGKKKFAYDVWGDAVNIASRLENTGEVGKVNISGETYQLIKDKFNCTYRGQLTAKGKGDIDMYFVEQAVLQQ
jgi:class 3 adenylate cyclase